MDESNIAIAISDKEQSKDNAGQKDNIRLKNTTHKRHLSKALIATVLCGAISLSPVYRVKSSENYSLNNIDSSTYISSLNNIHAADSVTDDVCTSGNYANKSFDEKSLPSKESLESIISSYAKSAGTFIDNDYYKNLREEDALKQLEKYGLKYGLNSRTVLVVNKTFQKAMVISYERQLYLYSKDSLASFENQGRKTASFGNDDEYIAEYVYAPKIIFETDCSTGRNSGNKHVKHDLKTPQGKFNIYEMHDSHDWTYEGLKAYGPIFFRIQDAIGVHGNGTDTVLNRNWKEDSRYKKPEPLGIYHNNFGHGLSHGCVRLDNQVLQKMSDEGLLTKGMDVIIFEDKELTSILSKYYNNNYHDSNQVAMR